VGQLARAGVATASTSASSSSQRSLTTIRAIPVEVRSGKREGLPSPCAANLDNIRTVARQWLDSRAGALPPSRHGEVKRALGYALGWDEPIDLGATPSG
jgi:mRNA-degrading endonuclease toxin of MazEF toxin-antitoxin module